MVAMQAKVKLIDRSHDSVRAEEIGLTGAHLVICEANCLYALQHRAVKFYQLAVDRISLASSPSLQVDASPLHVLRPLLGQGTQQL